jgi:hypothetical protein
LDKHALGLAPSPSKPKTASPRPPQQAQQAHQGAADALDALGDPTQNIDGDSDAENSDDKADKADKAEPPAAKSLACMRAEWLNLQQEKVMPVVIALFMKEIEADCVDYFFDFTESLPRII